MEAGVETSTHKLIEQLAEGSFLRNCHQPNHSLDQVPTLSTLEGAFRRIRPRKAAGADQLRSDLCGLVPQELSLKYHSLLTKMILTYSEPVQMKGGVLVAAYKQGASDCIDNFRSLLLSSHIGKAMRRTLRQQIVPLYDKTAPPLHVSVRAGGNVMHASHAMRAFLGAAHSMKKSTGVLYLDIKSAYYRTVRQLAANLTCSDQDIARVLQFFDLEPSEMHHLMEELRQASALQESGSTAHQELLVEELLHGTWFTTPTRRNLTESTAGTRPGDGLADVLFSFVFKRVMQKVQRSLQEVFQWPDPPVCAPVNIEHPPEQQPELPRYVEVVWADDLAFAVEEGKAEQVVDTMRIVTSHIFQQCLRHGMRPNMSKGKTEIMFRIQGLGSRQLRRDLYNTEAPFLQIEGVPEHYSKVRLTGSYRHLGHQLLVGDSIFAEIKSRTGQASSIYRKYKRLVFQNPRLPLSKRKYLFQALVLSVLRFNLGTWPRLSDKQFHYFQTKVMAMYRGLIRPIIAEPVLRFWNHARILEFLELPSAEIILHDARLRYSLSLLKSGPSMLWHLLAVEGEWLSLLQDSLTWMTGQLKGYGPDRTGRDFQQDWHTLFKQQPNSSKAWLGKACRHAILQFGIRTQWTEWHHEFLLSCQEAGLQIDFPWTAFGNTEVPAHGSLEACLRCRQLFRGKAPWSVHAFRKHGRVNWRRHYIDGSRCESCLKEFGTTSRLQDHLTYNDQCAQWHRRNLLQVDVKPGKNHTKRDRDPLLKLPVMRSEGPRRFGRHDLLRLEDPEVDYELLERLLDVEENIHVDSNVAETVEAFRQIFAESCSAFSCIKYSFDQFVQDMLIPELYGDDEPLSRKFRHILLLVQDQLRVSWFFSEEELSQVAPLPPDDEIRNNAWKYCTEDRRRKPWRYGNLAPWLSLRDFVIVHLFSGERRPQDLEEYLSKIQVPNGMVRTILSVDIIFDHKNANLADGKVQERWYSFIARGLIAILYAGPPCETWSSARSRGGVAGYSTGDGGPRVLRTSEWVYGLCGLRIKEALQIKMANILLTFTLKAMLLMLRCNRLGILEHPAPPAQSWLPSIWRLHALDILASHRRVHAHTILQGRYGGHSPKPTTLMIFSYERQAAADILEQFAVTAIPAALSMGKEEGSKEYATAKLKNYPALLCEALSKIGEQWWQDCANFSSELRSDEDFLRYVERLRCSFNTSARRGSDFAF